MKKKSRPNVARNKPAQAERVNKLMGNLSGYGLIKIAKGVEANETDSGSVAGRDRPRSKKLVEFLDD